MTVMKMKKLTAQILTAILMGIVVPTILLNIAVYLHKDQKQEPDTTDPQDQTMQEPESNSEVWIPVLLNDGKRVDMVLDDYLTGVVLAEMPSSFEPEAQKAQAVVARTYALRRLESGGKHTDGAVCTDPACCQGYLDPETFLQRGGEKSSLEKVNRCVRETSGQVLLYNGRLIEATYFSCSGGSTEDAVAVWGTDIPYLRATESPGEENAAHYSDTVYFTADNFQAALGEDLPGRPTEWFGTVSYTSGNGVAAMEIGGKVYTGTQLRSTLGLRSTAFTVTPTADGVTITTRGFGHRVGMSQYGADAMAVNGSDYRQILQYYYTGTELAEYHSYADN